MRTLSFLRSYVLGLSLVAALHGQTTGKLSPSSAIAVAAQTEVDLVIALHDAAVRNDDTAITAKMAAMPDARLKLTSSVALARRAATVCGWLRNENDYGRATKLARTTITQLASLTENTPADRAERLYWEAWLQGEVLHDNVRGIELLTTAEKLAPDDERLAILHLQFAAAVAALNRSAR